MAGHYNHRRYHEGLGDVTPYDVYIRRHLEVIQRRKEVKSRALRARRDYSRTIREQDRLTTYTEKPSGSILILVLKLDDG